MLVNKINRDNVDAITLEDVKEGAFFIGNGGACDVLIVESQYCYHVINTENFNLIPLGLEEDIGWDDRDIVDWLNSGGYKKANAEIVLSK